MTDVSEPPVTNPTIALTDVQKMFSYKCTSGYSTDYIITVLNGNKKNPLFMPVNSNSTVQTHHLHEGRMTVPAHDFRLPLGKF